MRFAIFICMFALMGLFAVPSSAQILDIDPEDITAEDQAVFDEREAAEMRVEDDMVKMSNLVEALSKNLGQLHFLRTLCFGENDQYWRDKTAGLLDAEAPDDQERRSELVRAFNAGYYQEKDRFETCSQSVSVDAAAIAENARNIATMLSDPYRQR